METNQVNGKILFANEVLETIAGIAVADIPGIANMKGKFMDSVSETFGGKRPAKGIKVTKTDDSLVFDVQIVVEYGIKIQDLCKTIQENIYSAIETMTSLQPSAVNVYVQSVKIKDAEPVAELKEGTEE